MSSGGSAASDHELPSNGGLETASGGEGAIPLEPPPHILLFTKTAGFRHDSIPDGIAAVKSIIEKRGWELTASEDSSLMRPEVLANVAAVMFLSTTGDILSEAEQIALQDFLESGGGFIGVHAAADTEPDWPWYRQRLGAHFESHPEIQTASIIVEVPDHLATINLTNPWLHRDEWYNYDVNPRDQVDVLLSLDETSYSGGKMGDHPIAWTREVEGSRLFYTGLGHTKESYTDTAFLAHLEGGIFWVIGL